MTNEIEIRAAGRFMITTINDDPKSENWCLHSRPAYLMDRIWRYLPNAEVYVDRLTISEER